MAHPLIKTTALLIFAGPGVALAGLEICNDTGTEQSVAIGYNGETDVWTSEGWWVIAPGGCTEPVQGDLPQRYYYIRSVSDAGTLEGDFTFCIEESVFTIEGDTDCEDRGYVTADFHEIDTGPTALNYTYRIAAGGETPAPLPVPTPPPALSGDAPDDGGGRSLEVPGAPAPTARSVGVSRVGGSRLNYEDMR